jgi:DNA invertase Pin-like site-specific DNA recombinase
MDIAGDATNVTIGEKEMADGKFVAYYRVSTKMQGDSGLGLEGQKMAVKQYLNGGNWELVEEVVEIDSGKNNKRIKLLEALKLCRIYDAKLLIAKLDRMSRDVHFISGLMESKVKFVCVDMPEANDMTIHIIAAVAQGEAKAISDRTKAAFAAARERRKANGQTTLGGMRSNSHEIHALGNARSIEVRQAKAEMKADDLTVKLMLAKEAGAVTLRQIAAFFNAKNIPTPRKGGQWSAVQIHRVIKRVGPEVMQAISA